MLKIKRLYIFILKTFLPLLLVTFLICLFIFLMQFLWKYVDQMVGKGISMVVLARMFFYAAVTFIPMSLPLAILLASLMSFGNLGEHSELLAIKAAGISLLRIMRPLVIVILCIASVSFYFQNYVLPATQLKLMTFMISIRQKSPEVEIPERIFYKDIPGINVYVVNKDKNTGMLHNVMLYDYSEGFDHSRIILADSAKLESSTDKHFLIVSLYHGKIYEDLGNTMTSTSGSSSFPYRRENFQFRRFVRMFDSNFNLTDQNELQGRSMNKTMDQIVDYIDSASYAVDSVNRVTKKMFVSRIYDNFDHPVPVPDARPLAYNPNSLHPGVPNPAPLYGPSPNLPANAGKMPEIRKWDKFIAGKSFEEQKMLVDNARSISQAIYNNLYINNLNSVDQTTNLINYKVELHRRYTLAFACVIFFFIGAPLGAIIRKGGLGMPTVVSVLLFIFYYIVDNFGSKLAKQSVWPIWEGMWLSTAILLILGIFFTYQAVNDSTMLNAEGWNIFLKKLMGKHEVRNYQRKELIMNPPDYRSALERIDALNEMCGDFEKKYGRSLSYKNFVRGNAVKEEMNAIMERVEFLVEDLRNSEENIIIGKLMDYPVVGIGKSFVESYGMLRKIFAWVLPVGLVLFLVEKRRDKRLAREAVQIVKVNDSLKIEINNYLERKKER